MCCTWMQQAQRTRYNHALEYAIREANKRDVPVVVVFGLTDGFPEAADVLGKEDS